MSGPSDGPGGVDPDPHRFLTVREVAAELRISRASVYRLLQRGALAGRRFGTTLRVSRQALDTYIRDSAADGSS